MKRPKPYVPQTPLSMQPVEPTPADEGAAARDTERKMQRRYGNRGRAATVLTGQGASGALG